MPILSLLASGATVVALGFLLWGESRKKRRVKLVAKSAASAGFVVAALGLPWAESLFGQILVVGLVFGALGDVLLLGESKRAFLSGLIAFLIGHVAYITAFLTLNWSPVAAGVALVPLSLLAVGVCRWVFPHASRFKVPIAAYVVAIGAMIALGAGVMVAGGSPLIFLGALFFGISDIAVVRHRFVRPELTNKLWGLPLYYAAQLLLVWSLLV